MLLKIQQAPLFWIHSMDGNKILWVCGFHVQSKTGITSALNAFCFEKELQVYMWWHKRFKTLVAFLEAWETLRFHESFCIQIKPSKCIPMEKVVINVIKRLGMIIIIFFDWNAHKFTYGRVQIHLSFSTSLNTVV